MKTLTDRKIASQSRIWPFVLRAMASNRGMLSSSSVAIPNLAIRPAGPILVFLCALVISRNPESGHSICGWEDGLFPRSRKKSQSRIWPFVLRVSIGGMLYEMYITVAIPNLAIRSAGLSPHDRVPGDSDRRNPESGHSFCGQMRLTGLSYKLEVAIPNLAIRSAGQLPQRLPQRTLGVAIPNLAIRSAGTILFEADAHWNLGRNPESGHSFCGGKPDVGRALWIHLSQSRIWPFVLRVDSSSRHPVAPHESQSRIWPFVLRARTKATVDPGSTVAIPNLAIRSAGCIGEGI